MNSELIIFLVTKVAWMRMQRHFFPRLIELGGMIKNPKVA